MKMWPVPTFNMSDPWTWLLQAFPAKTFHTLDSVPDLPANVLAFSGTYFEPFAWWDGQNLCWRTWQLCLIEGWGRYLGALAQIGYDAEWHCIPASAVGAPHGRDRVWIVADPIGDQQPRQEPCVGPFGRMGRVKQSLAWDRDWQGALTEFRGMDDGLPRSVASTDGYRNAVVPQIPELIGRAILESERATA